MSEQDTEKQDSQNTVDEEATSDETSEESTSEDMTEKNRKLYARLKKTEEELKALKEKPAEPQSTPDEHIQRLELKVDGYAEEEIKEIMKLGGKKVLENPIVKKAIDDLKAQRIAENAQVDTDSATSDISRKYSTADLEKMSTADLEKILPKN